MKYNVYVRADKYSDSGWRHVFVRNNGAADEYDVQYYENDEDYHFIETIEVSIPPVNKIAELGLAQVETMRKEAQHDYKKTMEKIADYESKFLLLS